MSYLTAMIMMFAPIKRLSEVNVTLQRGIAASESIFMLLDSKDEVQDSIISDSVTINKKISIEFKNVKFSYPSTNKLVINDVSFFANQGSTLAIVGRSGSGKTTILDLIPRLYEPSSGQILFNNKQISSMNLSQVRKLVSYVGQDFTLFNDTILNNIAYGELNISDVNDITLAAQQANAMDFINKLNNGINTIVGEKGVPLSGGQRQRIAIARAILKVTYFAP